MPKALKGRQTTLRAFAIFLWWRPTQNVKLKTYSLQLF
jgi:hypothetical protein